MSEDNGSSKGKIVIKKRSFVMILVLVLLAGALGGAFSYNAYVTKNDFTLIKTEDFETINGVYSKYAKLEMLYNYLNERYYKEIDQGDMMTSIYKGLFASPGDPYTSYSPVCSFCIAFKAASWPSAPRSTKSSTISISRSFQLL